ncbi:MAG: hypothetical protein GC182_06250 [Rhodopseudomonas sp.]|nr:hypothetical protein [Rhodopseudomonas sp.]
MPIRKSIEPQSRPQAERRLSPRRLAPAITAIAIVGVAISAGARGAQAADTVPTLNVASGCHAASIVAASQKHGRADGLNEGLRRDESSCRHEEAQAHAKLSQVWNTFSGRQRGHCVRLMSYGGSPSYVELLTCLEMGKAAAATPPMPANTKPPADG